MSELLGRWDLVVDVEGESFPSWVELAADSGQFVGKVGSARPLTAVSVSDSEVRFNLPPQYEDRKTDLEFTGALEGAIMAGSTTLDDGRKAAWHGTRAPALPYKNVTWGERIELIGSDLSNWQPRSPDVPNNWSVGDGMLTNSAVGSDLITTAKFTDFRLLAEYRYPKGSNSGIYLRGRYEFQIVDDFEGSPHGVGNSGAIYGFLAPSRNAVRAPYQWNTVEIVLVGRYVTVSLNGITVIDKQEIPGITGGALDSAEGEPGPLFVQGDHGPVSFRRLTVYQAV